MNNGGTDFRLDVENVRLWCGPAVVPLRRKTFDLLRFFAENPHRLLTKREILESVWPGIRVSPGLIKEYVHDLRHALHDDPVRPCFIETVHGRGYRFIAALKLGGQSEDASEDAHLAAVPQSIAVLAIENLTGEERWAQLCCGLTHDIVTELACSAIAVVPPSMARPEERAAPMPAVDHILVGSLQAHGGRLRLNLHLNRVERGHTVWAQRFECGPDEPLHLQDTIAARLRRLVEPAQDRSRRGRTLCFSRPADQPPVGNIRSCG